MNHTSSPTRTAAARVPDGWWTGHAGYRNYVLFAASGAVLAVVCVVLLYGIRAIGQGSAAWEAYLGALASVPGASVSAFLLLGTVLFAVRWLRIGAKIPVVRLGPLPAPPMPVIVLAHFGGLVTLSAIILVLLSGMVL
jgi:fumarate reductase subunit C